MPRFLRDRLSYSNVVATLALFVALGGTSYAAATITSSDIKNRSIKGGDIRRDTITGSEINESRLKEVPLARTAGTANTAVSSLVSDQSKNADNAIRASSAGSADTAANAANASQLGGQGVNSFEKSTRTTFGKASVDPGGASGETVLLSWPELGVQVTSATDQAGNCGGALSINLVNTKSGGGAALQLFQNGNAAGTTVPAGGKERFCTNSGAEGIDAEVTDSSGRTLFIDCVVSAGELRCIGTRSEA